MHRYVIRASASPEETGEFIASFAQGLPQPLDLRLDAFKRNTRWGSSGSSRVEDYHGLTPVEDEHARAIFTPGRLSTLRFESEAGERTTHRKIEVFGGSLAISGQFELPADDPFAIEAQNGSLMAHFDSPFSLRQPGTPTTARSQPRYEFMARVFEALADQVA